MAPEVMMVWPPHPLRYSLWDLDNCLFNDAWRTPLIEWDKAGNERYNLYDAAMKDDKPAHLTEWRIITAMSVPIFITGRRERWRDITMLMIQQHLPLPETTPPRVLMRPDDSNERPVALKERLLKEFLMDEGYDMSKIMAAFDDVQSIVDMYRRHGIPAAVLRCHDPLHSYNIQDL